MKIGIVTISFNQARFLAEAIESVCISAPNSLCYVIVDAGSTDDSRSIIERYRSRFHRIILEPDRGPSDGLNKGFSVCDADVYGFLNSDDRLVPGALDLVADYFSKTNDVDVLSGGIRIIDENGTPRFRGRTPDAFDLRRLATGTCLVCQQGTFFTRRIFERTAGFNLENRTCWDGELLVDMALAGARFAIVRRALGDLRVYRGTITDNIWNNGALKAVNARDFERINRKISVSGIAIPGRFSATIERWMYKFNVARHIRYLTIR